MSRYSSVGWVVAACIAPIFVGCSPDADWQAQFGAVKTGVSHSIRLEDRPISSSQLTSLTGQGGLSVSGGKLHDLLLDGGGVSDAQMADLGRLGELEHLRIRKSQISDHGLKLLSEGQLDSLRILNLPQAVVTQRGIAHLRVFASLENLRLGGRQLDDEAVREIASLPSLRSLHLIGPGITGKALDYLAEAPKLTSLYIDDCVLTDDAWVRLFDSKPSLHVHIDQHHHDRDPNPEN